MIVYIRRPTYFIFKKSPERIKLVINVSFPPFMGMIVLIEPKEEDKKNQSHEMP